jgi:uncharacterized protein YcfJ
MKSALLAFTLSAAVVAPTLAAPEFASAARLRDYGSGDICAHDRRVAGNRGAVTGAIIGGILGNRIAGRGSRTGGTIVGAGVGAVAGNAIGRNSVRCIAPPRRTAYRDNCQWLEDEDGPFEVCRDRRGDWRPTGRA